MFSYISCKGLYYKVTWTEDKVYWNFKALGNIFVLHLLILLPEVFNVSDSICCKKVDLLAGNGEGITPLHDAVLNNQVDVCRVLLQHGGPNLLQAQTVRGYTPLDLAESDDMVALLTSYSHVRRRPDDSLNLIGSQGEQKDLHK